MSLLVARDRPAQSVHEELVEDSQPVEWFDAINYPAAPKTDADGRLELPGLIPGARYSIAIGSGPNKVVLDPLTLQAGQSVTIPDVVLANKSKGVIR